MILWTRLVMSMRKEVGLWVIFRQDYSKKEDLIVLLLHSSSHLLLNSLHLVQEF